ncbi:MAG: hypothetical protein WCK98_02185 [bacterium]
MGFNIRVRNKNKYKVKLKSLFKKLFGGLNLVLLLVVVFGFAGNLGGGLKVEAAVKAVKETTYNDLNEAAKNGATGCSQPDFVGGRKNYGGVFCEATPANTSSGFPAALTSGNLIDGCKPTPNVKGEESCSVGGKNYTICKIINPELGYCSGAVSDSGTTKPGDTTVVTSKSYVDTKAAIRCEVDASDIKITSDIRVGFNYALKNCINTNTGQSVSNTVFSCVAWAQRGDVKPDNTIDPNNIKFGCLGGDQSKYLQFDNTNSSSESMQVWDGGDCYVFMTPTGSACIKKAEVAVVCDGAGLGLLPGSIQRTVFGIVTGSLTCNTPGSIDAFRASKDFFKDTISGPQGIAGVSGGTLSDDCKKAKDVATKKTPPAKEFTCNNGQKFTIDDTGKVTAPDGTVYDANGNKVNTSVSDGKNLAQKAADGIADFIIKVASIALAIVLYIFTIIGLIILFFFGVFVLWLLDINPASLSFVEVAQKPWGLLASVGNILILGAFMYVGFGYMMGIANMKKNLGDFLMKIIYYAMLLNFTLLGAATIVNVGYGVGNLIKYAYASSTSKEDVNQQLMGNIIGPIGRISYLRCPDKESPECNFQATEKINVLGQATGKNPVAGITSFWKDSGTALAGAVAEGVTLIMILFAIYVFWKALYVVFYRVVALWMLMILSPIALASYFSPVDEWKSIGKTMFDKFWKLVLFYPAFIFALVLVNTMSGAFLKAIGTTPTTATATTAASSSSTATPFSISVFAENISTGSGTDFQKMTVTVLGAGVALMGLWAVTKYFSDSFEADMGKIGGGIKAGYEGAIKGYQGLKKGVHTAFMPMRAAGWAGKGALKKFGVDVDKIGANWEKGNGFQRFGAAVGRTTSNLLTGRTLYDLENKAGMAKKLWDGLDNGEKKVLAGQKARDDVKNSVLLRKLGLGGILDDSGTDAARGLSPDVLKGDEGKKLVNNLIGAQVASAKSSVVADVKDLPDDVVEAKLRAMIDPNTGETKINDDILNDLLDQALKTGNKKVLQMIMSNSEMSKAARGMVSEKRLSEDSMKAVSKEYGSFLDDNRVQINARAKAGQKLYNPTTVEMMDDRFNESYLESLQARIEQGEEDAVERKNNYLASRAQQLGDISKRAYSALYQNYDKDHATHREEDFYDPKMLGGAAASGNKPHGLTHSDYTAAAKAVAGGVSGAHPNMTDAEYNQMITANPELAQIGNKKGMSIADRKKALSQAFSVGKKIHAARASTEGLETQKALLEKIASSAALNAEEELKLGIQHEAQIETDIVNGIMQEYSQAEIDKDADEYRAKNAGSTQREAVQKVKEARKKIAEQSAKAIKQHISSGIDGNPDAHNLVEAELARYMDTSTAGIGQDLANKARDTAQGNGAWASGARSTGQTKAQQMASSGAAATEVARINAEIENLQKEAIKKASKQYP